MKPEGLAPLEPLEIAAGMVLEPAHAPRPPRLSRRGPDARQALENVILGHLAEGHSSVSFSGGRDSSLILSLACHVARREGLPDPVAITMRHRSAQSQEQDYQELVVSHLRLRDWVRIDVEDSMDVLGPRATSSLVRTGVQAPPNAYLHIPMIERAPLGTLMTGAGGDEFLGSTGSRVVQVLSRRARPHPTDVLAFGYALAPTSLRRWRERRRPFPWSPWLTPEAGGLTRARIAITRARVRARWDVEARLYARSRQQCIGMSSLNMIASTFGKRIASPLSDVAVVDALARDWGPVGPRSRSEAMRRLAGDLLPERVLTRTTKAEFGGVIWGPAFRRFVQGVSAEYLAPEVARLVVFDKLLEAWRRPLPPYQSMTLAQHAWLTAERLTRSSPR